MFPLYYAKYCFIYLTTFDPFPQQLFTFKINSINLEKLLQKANTADNYEDPSFVFSAAGTGKKVYNYIPSTSR